VTNDVSAGIEDTRTLVDPDDVNELVAAWIQDVLSTTS
jgi:hypothetical protein